jgi:hypothetical protein
MNHGTRRGKLIKRLTNVARKGFLTLRAVPGDRNFWGYAVFTWSVTLHRTIRYIKTKSYSEVYESMLYTLYTSYMFRPLIRPSSLRLITKNRNIEMLQKFLNQFTGIKYWILKIMHGLKYTLRDKCRGTIFIRISTNVLLIDSYKHLFFLSGWCFTTLRYIRYPL